ncbi:EthD family reductase [Phreatobacter sp. AB_2022a]|uniref:EthD family reductase n=1 Tax=Phreatobacter sp. AB_2022a TaxID=3003134 RepID=UPI002286E0C1|nr:EthD family reductase [Phreatobacter sp. AB_2022a]MCZ0734124.1 EthD family reductase [Phreatobacter sp. AB_2022a]
MARLVVIYKTPKDPKAFDDYYFASHVPLAKKIPGLRRYEVSEGAVGSPVGASGVHLVATLHFDSVQAIQDSFRSPVGLAAAGDLVNFADGGADLYFFETRAV